MKLKSILIFLLLFSFTSVAQENFLISKNSGKGGVAFSFHSPNYKNGNLKSLAGIYNLSGYLKVKITTWK